MRLRNITLAGIILSMLAFTIGMAGAAENGTVNETPAINVTAAPTETLTATSTANTTEDEAADEGSASGIFAPGHLLYRLQIAFENMGETFTYNASEKLGKQVSHARHRINEYRAALKRNDTKAADIALAEYGVKVDDMNNSMSKLSDNDTGFINARQMIMKHQLILENLSILYPNSTGLQKAYSNSRKLQAKFVSKMEKKPDLDSMKENRETQKTEKTVASARDGKPEKGTRR
jgi:hypothetical protein